jgi:hypothetical protein
MLLTDLLFAPYTPPALHKGDRATCLFREGEVVITAWSDAPLSWPRCRRIDHQGGGSGLLVTDELVRAILSESSLALQHWFGVGADTVWRWRKAFGVLRWGTEGSKRLHILNVQSGARKTRGRPLRHGIVEKRLATRLANGTGWSAEEVAMLERFPDEEVVLRGNRSLDAVRAKRNRQKRCSK